jgi:pimeloyl-ACP methyl ester carboxylesterase
MHSEYVRHVQDSRFAVLMIHGITGSPRHFDMLLPEIPEDWSVYNILLPGHGGTVADFGASSMKKWREAAKAALELALQRHEKVLIVGHSMGTLFAIQGAIEHPDRVAGLFLLAVPLRPWVRFSSALTCLRLLLPVREDDVAAQALLQAAGTKLEPNPLKYIPWAPSMLELLGECRKVRKMLPQLGVAAKCFQSRVDEMVSMRSCKYLEPCAAVRLTVLEHSGHFAYGQEDVALLRRELADTVAQMTGQ